MINWIITSSVLILIIIAARQLLKGHISPQLQYALWLLVLVRLLVPFNPLESSISILNAVPAYTTSVSDSSENTEHQVPETVPTVPAVNSTAAHNDTIISDAPEIQTSVSAQSDLFSLSFVLCTIWLTGTGVLLIYAIIRNYRLARYLHRTRRPFGDDTYVVPTLPSSCLFGVLKPSIYITQKTAANEQTLKNVLAHERAHRRHGDHIWNMLRVGVLALHWYNPLVWWACSISKRDAEMAADAVAIASMDPKERVSYGGTLLEMLGSAAPRDTWFSCSTSMISTKRALRERIEAIVKNARTAVSMAVIVLLMAIAVVGCTFTGAKGADPNGNKNAFDSEEFIPLGREKIDTIARWTKEDHGLTYTDVSDTLGEWISSSEVMKDIEVTDYYMLEMSEGSMLGVIYYNPTESYLQQMDKMEQMLEEAAASMNTVPTFLGGGNGIYHFAIDALITGKYGEYADEYPYRYLIENNPWILELEYAEPILNTHPLDPYVSKMDMDFYIQCAVENFGLTYEDASEQLLQGILDTGFERDDLIEEYHMTKMSDGSYVGIIVFDPSVARLPYQLLQNNSLEEAGLIKACSSSYRNNTFFEYLFILQPADVPLGDIPLVHTGTVKGSIIWASKNGLYE